MKDEIKIEQEYGSKFKPLLDRIKDRVKNLKRGIEKGLINTKAKSSITMRDDGDINIVSSKYAQEKLSAGLSTKVANEDVSISNTKKVMTDQLILNNHKFNNLLYEYADVRAIDKDKEKLVTGLALEATVLTKSWEPDLERYVLIRRPARFAMFSPELNVADAPENLGINTAVEKEFVDMVDIESAANKYNDLSREV